MDHIAILIRKDLELDVPGMLHKVFDIHGVIAERQLCLLLGGLEAPLEFLRRIGNPHALAAAAKRCLHDDRVSDLFRYGRACSGIEDWFRASGDDRHARRSHGIPRLLLVPKLRDNFGIRSDKCNIALLAQFREPAVLRQEPKARMDRVGSCHDGSADDTVHAQITLRGRRRTDADCLIRKLRVKRLSVGLRVDRHRLNSHLPAGTDNTHCDLAPIGD